MANQQIAVNPAQIATSSRCSQELKQRVRKELAKAGSEEVRKKVCEITSHCLATLMVSTIFLGVTYLFLTQLAEGGW